MTNPLRTSDLKDLNSFQLMELVEESREAAIRMGTEYVEANKRFKDLKELMPSFLAEIHLLCLEKNITSTKAKLEAISAKEYQSKVKEMNEAERKARLLEVECKAHLKTLEALSAISYVKNQELKMLR